MNDKFKIIHIGSDTIKDGDILVLTWNRNERPTPSEVADFKDRIERDLLNSSIRCPMIIWPALDLQVMSLREVQVLKETLEVILEQGDK